MSTPWDVAAGLSNEEVDAINANHNNSSMVNENLQIKYKPIKPAAAMPEITEKPKTVEQEARDQINAAKALKPKKTRREQLYEFMSRFFKRTKKGKTGGKTRRRRRKTKASRK